MSKGNGSDVSLQILALACEHCAYAAADLAGSLRMQYPATIKIVQVPCTGRVDVLLLLRAIEDGVDGVMVAGCLPGDCHYLEGNFNAQRRVRHVQKLLAEIGLEPERVQMFNLSSAMAGRFVAIAQQMHDCIRGLGPNPLRKLNQEQASLNRPQKED